MSLTKRQRTSANRMQIAASLGGAVLVKLAVLALHPQPIMQSIVFGDVTGWPDFMRGFWPLDILVCAIGLWIVLRGLAPHAPYEWVEAQDSLRNFLRILTTMFFGGGLCIGSLVGGWFFAAEFGFATVLFGDGAMLAIFLLLATVFGIGWTVKVGYRRFWPPLSGTAFGRLIRRLTGFFEANDVSDDAPAGTEAAEKPGKSAH